MSESTGRSHILAGIFIGGQSTRMGGSPKGLLRAPSGETLVLRWKHLFDDLSIPSVLVGNIDVYESTGLSRIDDAARGIGPLGGLTALLERAGHSFALSVACDMPYVSAALLAKLADHPSPAPAVAPRQGTLWQPLFARYRADQVLGVARACVERGVHSLQALLDELGATPLLLDANERAELRDWDTPEDVARE
ncbi:MAG TPA: molybdenum cofactor guanylyltransferase [Polyangiaceae bacterium]|jgi:molybdopterin-guanine dinucleotide biosynthesis protein A